MTRGVSLGTVMPARPDSFDRHARLPAVPARLLRAQPPVLRPQDADWWRHPAKELRRLAAAGVIASPAHGYYVVPPATRVGDREWRPTLEGFALALGQRVGDIDRTALMGVSAARVHGAMPRAVGVGVLAVGHRRRRLHSAWGQLLFVFRDVTALDVQRTETDLTAGWVTTVEQTLLDVADRPHLGGLDARAASEIVTALGARADWQLVADLAQRQRRRAAFARARWVADPVVDTNAPAPAVPAHRERYAPALGLRPARSTAAQPFGVDPSR